MPVFISMLRGVNVGLHNRIKMEALRELYVSLNLEDPRTYVQSGNVIFHCKDKNGTELAKKIQDAIGKKFGFRPDVILRTRDELRKRIAANPFSGRCDVHPGKLLVTFFAKEPPKESRSALSSLKTEGEELHLKGRELYIYFPNGAGKSNLPWSTLAQMLKTTGTARNWNSVLAMLRIAEEMVGAEE